MVLTILSWAAAALVLGTATGLLLNRDWRWDLALLAAQYLGASILVAQHWPIGMAAAKLVTGWMTTAALGMTLNALPSHPLVTEKTWPSGRAFRLFMIGMMVALTVAITPRMDNAVPGLGQSVIAGGILLIGIGLLHLGTTSEIARVIFALLTILSGFEALYAGVESSILVAALLSVVTLGLGLAGAYLINTESVEEDLQ